MLLAIARLSHKKTSLLATADVGVMSKNMFKISGIQTKETDSDFVKIAKLFEDIEFSITVKKSNGKQLDSNIDERIIHVLSKKYKIHNSKGKGEKGSGKGVSTL